MANARSERGWLDLAMRCKFDDNENDKPMARMSVGGHQQHHLVVNVATMDGLDDRFQRCDQESKIDRMAGLTDHQDRSGMGKPRMSELPVYVTCSEPTSDGRGVPICSIVGGKGSLR